MGVETELQICIYMAMWLWEVRLLTVFGVGGATYSVDGN